MGLMGLERKVWVNVAALSMLAACVGFVSCDVAGLRPWIYLGKTARITTLASEEGGWSNVQLGSDHASAFQDLLVYARHRNRRIRSDDDPGRPYG